MKLQGGPYSGHALDIRTGSTLVFSARGMTGFYSGQGVWHNVGNVIPLQGVLEGADRTTAGTIGQP